MCNSTTIPPNHKACSQCGKVLPHTSDYFCRAGVKGDPDKLRSECRECGKENHRRRYAENRDALRAEALSRYYANHEANKERHREYMRSNRDVLSVKEREYRQKNREMYRLSAAARRARIQNDPEKYRESLEYRRQYNNARRLKRHEQQLEYERQYREKNRDKKREIALRWARRNPEKTREIAHRRRARWRNSPGTHTSKDIRSIYEQQDGRCYWCQKPVGDDYHVDHRIPLARGGTNAPDNIVISCPDCNMRKGAKMPWEWNGRLL